MNTKINTMARFMISTFYIGNGITLMNTFCDFDLFAGPLLLFSVGCIELASALFLFLGYKIKTVVPLLLGSTLLVTLFNPLGILEFFSNLGLVAGLLLLINNGAGETFWQYALTDIENLPEYKVNR